MSIESIEQKIINLTSKRFALKYAINSYSNHTVDSINEYHRIKLDICRLKGVKERMIKIDKIRKESQ